MESIANSIYNMQIIMFILDMVDECVEISCSNRVSRPEWVSCMACCYFVPTLALFTALPNDTAQLYSTSTMSNTDGFDGCWIGLSPQFKSREIIEKVAVLLTAL